MTSVNGAKGMLGVMFSRSSPGAVDPSGGGVGSTRGGLTRDPGALLTMSERFCPVRGEPPPTGAVRNGVAAGWTGDDKNIRIKSTTMAAVSTPTTSTTGSNPVIMQTSYAAPQATVRL